ncbi:M3 family metallopeptidase [Pinirhizobacter soli]|uniref:M3 family metallopeptidase n=1 Tax=Pinirhizobacter soli TaxID=2786953 RepID=UPI00202A67A8|nr:M3 family metallopeptidase [Pinirhizobacter soli]
MKTLPMLCLLAFASPAVFAQDHRIDGGAYFASPAQEATDRAQLATDIAALPVLDAPTPTALLDYLHRSEALLSRAQRHGAWLHLQTARDIDDQAAAQASSDVGAERDTLVTRAQQTLRKLGKDGFDRDVAALPELGRYRWLFEGATRNLPHELPEGEQKVMDDLSDQASTAYWNIYQKTRRATAYGKVLGSHGELDAGKDADALATDPDRNVRQRAWLQREQALAAQGETYASILVGIVGVNDHTARLQNFADAPEAIYFARMFDRADVDATARAVQAQASALMDYQRLRAAHIGRQLGLETVHSWDLAVPLAGFTPPAFDYDELRRIIPLALAPLGRDYTEHFRQLLDPANQRTDLATAQGNRVNDSFSIEAPGVPTGLFLGQWKPTLKAASVVAHEGGHALHSQLMNEHGVSPFYNHGSSWMQEGVAILNEMLFYEYLYRHADSPAAKAHYLQAQLDEMTFEIFTSAEEAQLEAGIYDGVVAGKIHGASDMDKLTLETTRRFEIWPSVDPELAHAWIGKRLMFEDPLYLANYLYAGLWATKMFDMATHDPADFQKRYAALMAEGFDASPKVLLNHFFGRDLAPDQLVGDASGVIRRKTAALQALYRQLDSHITATVSAASHAKAPSEP